MDSSRLTDTTGHFEAEDGFHDLHEDTPDGITHGSQASSLDSNTDCELLVKMKRELEEGLGIKLTKNHKRPKHSTVECSSDLVDASNQLSLPTRCSQSVLTRTDCMSSCARPPQSCYKKEVQCDKAESTYSFDTSDSEHGQAGAIHASVMTSFGEHQQSMQRVDIEASKIKSSGVVSETDGKVRVSIDQMHGTIQIGSNNHMHVKSVKCSSKQAKTDMTGQRRKVQIKVPKRLITDGDIDEVATRLGNDWRRLGTKLGFVKGELDAFEYDNHTTGLHEITYQMLLTWREKQGTEASIRKVASELIAIKRPDVAKLFSVN